MSLVLNSKRFLFSPTRFLARHLKILSAPQQQQQKPQQDEKETHFGFETVRESEKAEKGLLFNTQFKALFIIFCLFSV